MTTPNKLQKPATKRRWFKQLLFIATGLLVLLVAAWFVVTSDAFFRGTILPKVGKAMNATLTAEAASISPFSQATIRGLKLQTTGTEPLLTVGEVRARYSLLAMLGGTITVDEVLIDSPVITVVINADGTCNLDALNQESKGAAKPSPPPATPGETPKVDLKQFHLKNATARYLQHHADGTKDTIEITGLDVTLDDVKNGAAGKLAFALQARAELNTTNAAQRGSVTLKHDGNYTFTLGSDLFPTQIRGRDKTDITQATGAFALLANAGIDLTVDMSPTDIKGIVLSFRKDKTTLAALSLSGLFDAVKHEGKLDLVLTGADHKLLNLAGAAAGLDFGSTALTFTNTIVLAQGGSSINIAGRLAAANLQVAAPGQPAPIMQAGANYDLTLLIKPAHPMQATGRLALDEFISHDGVRELHFPGPCAEFDVAMAQGWVELKKLLLKLKSTARAKNEILIAGRLDISTPEDYGGGFKLTSQAFDVTPYHEMLTALTNRPATTQPTGAAAPEKEPDAIILPFRDFTFDVAIDHLYLHEVDAANVRANAKLDGGRVSVKPIQFTLNGAPVSGSLDLNLGVPGFEYEFTLDASDVPLPPLVNSFAPDRKGQLSGTATAAAQLKGAGVTGASLQKNLSGEFDLVTTNLNLALSEIRTPVIKTVVNILAAIPGAIRNPTEAVGNLLGRLTGMKRSDGWTDELMKSPINSIVVHGTAGNGRIELKEAYVQSSALRAGAAGNIDLAEVLTNSVMHFPVSMALSKNLSDKIGLTPADTPTNAVYVALPEFVRMGGTLGVPKPDVKYLVLGQITLKSAAGLGANMGSATGEKVTGALNAVGGLIGGGTTTTNTPPNSTNAPATDPATQVIRGIGGLFGGGKKSAEANPPTNNPNP